MEKKEKRDVKSWKEKIMILYEFGGIPPFSPIHCFFSRLFSSPPFSPSLFILFCFFGNMPHHFFIYASFEICAYMRWRIKMGVEVGWSH